MYLAHQEIESVNIASIVIVGEIDCGSQPFCADSCEVAFLILWQDAQVQKDGHSYTAESKGLPRSSSTTYVHMLARKKTYV